MMDSDRQRDVADALRKSWQHPLGLTRQELLSLWGRGTTPLPANSHPMLIRGAVGSWHFEPQWMIGDPSPRPIRNRRQGPATLEQFQAVVVGY